MSDMPFNSAKFNENRNAIPPEELEKYAGQWVAWHLDGTHIIAGSSVSIEAMWDLALAAGYKPDEFVSGYIPGDEVIFGGGLGAALS